jgi:hypothetical protein
MNTDTVKTLQVGDQVRFRDSNSLNSNGVVTELLPDGYARVRWIDLACPTTHRTYALEIVPDPGDMTLLLESLSDLARDLEGE